MKFDFKGKTAIVTGAGLGIGYEIARQLALAGASVLLNDIDAHLAEKAAAQITAEGGGVCMAAPGDSSEVAFIQSMTEQAVAKLGGLDIAIANAGITTFGQFLEYTPEQFQRLIAVNLQGSFFLAQAATRQMRLRGRGGRILFMSSVTGFQAHPDLAAYGMTKAGLQMLARALSLELGPMGITVNAIAPGATLTERTAQELPNYAEVWGSVIPTGRAGTPADIAHTALFLCSEQAGQITGQTLIVDGGWTGVGVTPQY